MMRSKHIKRKKEDFERHLQDVFKSGMHEAAVSKDGHLMEIAANIASVDLLNGVLSSGADGVGLFQNRVFIYESMFSAESRRAI